jgi:hypothetical protein
VGDRLAHHLDPMRFPKSAYAELGLLIAVWLLLQRDLDPTPERRRWRMFVVASLLIAGVGILAGWGPRPLPKMPGYAWRMTVLKFYPFRLADLMVPAAVSFTVAAWGLDRWRRDPNFTGCRRGLLPGLLAILAGAAWIPFADENPSRLSPAEQTDWIACCRWLAEQTPPNGLAYAADSGWAVKWFSNCPEFVNYKDMPQDAAGITEWNRRLWELANWRIAATADGKVTAAELRDLRKRTGIVWLLSGRFGPIESKPVFDTKHFRVHQLPPAE